MNNHRIEMTFNILLKYININIKTYDGKQVKKNNHINVCATRSNIIFYNE